MHSRSHHFLVSNTIQREVLPPSRSVFAPLRLWTSFWCSFKINLRIITLHLVTQNNHLAFGDMYGERIIISDETQRGYFLIRNPLVSVNSCSVVPMRIDNVDISDIPNRDCACHVVNRVASKWSQAKRSARDPTQFERFGIKQGSYMHIAYGDHCSRSIWCATLGATHRAYTSNTDVEIRKTIDCVKYGEKSWQLKEVICFRHNV